MLATTRLTTDLSALQHRLSRDPLALDSSGHLIYHFPMFLRRRTEVNASNERADGFESQTVAGHGVIGGSSSFVGLYAGFLTYGSDVLKKMGRFCNAGVGGRSKGRPRVGQPYVVDGPLKVRAFSFWPPVSRIDQRKWSSKEHRDQLRGRPILPNAE